MMKNQSTTLASASIGVTEVTNDNKLIKTYLSMLSNNELFEALSEPEKNKIIFTSHELLKDYFTTEKLTDRAVALQVLYSLEGEDEEYSKLKRHGVTSYSVKGVSVSFDGSGISPDVIRLLGSTKGAKAKRLI